MPTEPTLPYGENVCLDTLATRMTYVGLKTIYDCRAENNPSKPIPPDERISKLAAFLKKRSIRNGPDNYLGSADIKNVA